MKKQVLLCLSLLAACAVCAHAGDAKEVYDKQCAKCHGADGKGGTKMGQKIGVKDLTDAKRQQELTDVAAFKAVKEGLKDGEKVRMKAIEGLSDEDIKGVVGYIRKFKK